MPSYLGQNFLKDMKYVFFIAEKAQGVCQELDLSTIIEIGPGKGALTKKLLPLDRPMILFEKDETLKETLMGLVTGTKAQIIRGDVLTQDPVALLKQHWHLPGQTLVMGNLPYYITSPILLQFFGGENPKFDAGIFMIQKEVADKISRDAEKKSFLWRMLNYHYDVTYLKTVPAKAFSPKPKVQSSIILLKRKKDHPSCAYDQMRVILERISMYKRKTLWKSRKMAQKSLKDWDPGDSNALILWDYTYILPERLQGKRIEEVSWDEMDEICRIE